MKEANYHYETVTEAIRQLRANGFTTDFNLKGNCIICNEVEYADDEFHITDIFRYGKGIKRSSHKFNDVRCNESFATCFR